MDREIVDPLLTAMLQTGEDISDLLFISGNPPLVEIHGRLNRFSLNGPGSVLTPLFIQQLADHLMGGSERLQMEFAAIGSCDCSYAIENLARFRVNAFVFAVVEVLRLDHLDSRFTPSVRQRVGIVDVQVDRSGSGLLPAGPGEMDGQPVSVRERVPLVVARRREAESFVMLDGSSDIGHDEDRLDTHDPGRDAERTKSD